MLKITIFNEFMHERDDDRCKAIYPEGIHKVLADFIGKDIECQIKCFTTDDVNEGLTDAVLDDTDVILWWGHAYHQLVSDETAKRVSDHVLGGMGAVFLHSSHKAKPFMNLMGTTCNLRWREEAEREILWVTDPTHPVAAGIPDHFELEHEETYGELFDIPQPDALVFISWFSGGNVFRSGCAYKRGMGRIFYFQPGHETFPTYKDGTIQKVINNAVKWVTPVRRLEKLECMHEVDAVVR